MNPSEQPGAAEHSLPVLRKAASGIPGFDEVTHGGLPYGRTSLVCGAAGAGKTLFGMQFLVRGIIDYDEPGVFLAFEETEEDLSQNVASLGFDLRELVETGKLALDHIRVERSEIEESGEYNLEGLFLRLELAIETVGAKRVVIDTLETLFGGLNDYAILRSELRRLFRWLKDRGVSAIITAERGEGQLTRHGLEEYVSDCVILLDHRVTDQVSTRRLRVVKYRGTTHGTNEYPFLIDEEGITVMPITAAGLQHDVSDERVSTGVPGLDGMLGGEGYFRGSTVLVSGTAGAGKSSLSAHFADATCRRGEHCLYFAFEESPAQIKRNMASIGLDLGKHEEQGLLKFVSARPTMYGLETHLAIMHKLIREFQPRAVVVDPVSNLISAASQQDAHQMVVRLIDHLKSHGVTAVMTSLTGGGEAEEGTEVAISSIVDTWLLVRSLESSGERNRGLYVLKSRGMNHSHQVREFVITSDGIELVEVYVGPEGVLTGSARAQQEDRERAARRMREQEIARKQRELERKRKALEHSIEAMRAEFESEEEEISMSIAQQRIAEEQLREDRLEMAARRGADRKEAGKQSEE
ncbi:circadian clock protein KaiC [Gilvimarinus sp. F26214L]|uniref:circadian clock protein KaiC n=1 Tax=Gilvimarinus sp. DZF01 TaxID=3461371 RepID=UPI004045EC57